MNSVRLITVALLASVVGSLPSAEPAGRVSLRVLTYNIHHGEGTDGKVDLPRLAKVITAAKSDLVALQEVDDKTRRTGRVDQTAKLARLTGLHGKFGKQIDYEGGGYGQAILSRYPIDELKVHWLPGTPERERRIAVEAHVKISGTVVSFVSTHLHHIRDEFRQQQATKLNELFAGSRQPVILAGDLNANPDSKPLDILREKWLLATAGSSLLTYPSPKPTKQIDYILCQPGKRFQVIEARVIDEAVASDHRPVLAVVTLAP